MPTEGLKQLHKTPMKTGKNPKSGVLSSISKQAEDLLGESF